MGGKPLGCDLHVVVCEQARIRAVPARSECQPQRRAEDLQQVRQLLDLQLTDPFTDLLQSSAFEIPLRSDDQQCPQLVVARDSRAGLVRGRIPVLTMSAAVVSARDLVKVFSTASRRPGRWGAVTSLLAPQRR